MIHELVVTSAPRGLQAGRSGFTTVLRTRGIHPELQAKLEQASAYRHVYAQGDARNPRILSHAIVQSPAGQVSVLSSIVDVGNGYDGRSNKLAHHLALDGGEVSARTGSSPAAVLMTIDRAGGFLRRWSGEPREQPAAAHVPPTASSEPAFCGAWARAAGDAGWAGFIVERALRREPTWIIAAPDVDLMELFSEALALAQPAQRWKITFTTYAVGQPDALWMGTVDGSPEAQAARGQSRVAVVDLVRKAPLATTSPLVEAARGKGPVPWRAEPAEPGGVAAGATHAAAAVPNRPPPIAGRPGAPPPLANPFAFATTTERSSRPAAAGAEHKQRTKPRSWLPFAMVALALAVAAALIALAVMAFGGRAQKPAAEWPQTKAGRQRDGGQDSASRGDVGGTVRPLRPAVVPQARPQPATAQPGTPPGPSPPAVSGPGVEATVGTRVGGAPPPLDAAPPKPRLPVEPPRGQANAAAAAFDRLRGTLDSTGHLPEEGLDGRLPQEKEVRLCALDGAKIVPRLPDAEFSPATVGGLYRLSCVPAGEQAWKIICSSAGQAGGPGPLEVGGVRVCDDGLFAGLVVRVAPNDPGFAAHAAAREAAATTILILANADRPQDTTYVQLCRPVVGRPIVVEQFFFDDRLRPRSVRRDVVEEVKLFLGASPPATPWPIEVRLAGSSVEGGLSGKIVELEAIRAPAARPTPGGCTIEWSPASGEPVMRTRLQFATNEVPDTIGDPREMQFWLQSSDVLEPWNTFRFCADLNQARPPRIPMHQLPRASLLKIGSEVPADSDDAEVDFALIRSFSDVCRQYPRAPLDLVPFESGGRRPVSEWKQLIRGAIAKSADYRAWVESNDPGDRPDPPGDWEEKRAIHEEGRKASPRAVAAYWARLKKSQERTTTTHADVALCCLLEELDAVPPRKQAARTLIEGLGDGDAELRGEFVADFKGVGRCVLLTLDGRDPVFVSSRKPVPSARRDRSRTHRPLAAAGDDRLDVSPPADR